MEPFLAEIKMFGGNFAPRGYALCFGQLMSIAQNTALFSLLGTTYGGNGTTTFGLPDMRGRVPMGMGSGPGLTPRVMGELAGSEAVTLISTEMPAHTHTNTVGAVTGPGTQAGPAGARMAESTARDNVYSTAAADTTMAPDTIGIAGGSQPHNNMQPFLCVNFIIALEGIFPVAELVQSEFDAFRDVVLATPDLQQPLLAETDVHRFLELVVAIGASHGFSFSPADVRDAMAENRRAWLGSQLV